MINAEITNNFKKLVGKQYFAKVNTMLIERGIKKKNGEPYKNTTVSMVLSGERENLAIQDVLTDIYNEAKASRESKKKPEAATSGSIE